MALMVRILLLMVMEVLLHHLLLSLFAVIICTDD